MMSTFPASLFGYIFNTRPSGYCGAANSICQSGTNKTTIKPSPHRKVIILESTDNFTFFILNDLMLLLIQKQRNLFLYWRQQNVVNHIDHSVGCRNRSYYR